ncbi:hypothetical protein [Halorussus caseinilyticus]|uniref:hypothetical protein n=1 Tax=Halorussus caseinilyticus TaxID=3034025 RepID=UPI0023E7CECA|nr:hypothetical protein [Halorussus sp. DT72]
MDVLAADAGDAATTDGETTEAARAMTAGPAALGTATTQPDVEVENLVSLGVAIVGTEAGEIVSRSRLGLDRTLPERRSHLVVQDLNVVPNRDPGWRIRSSEAVHDWRSGYAPIIAAAQHEPNGGTGGPVQSVGLSLGLSGPSASWSYSQPNVTRRNLSSANTSKWRWQWKRPSRNSENFKIGSLVAASEPAERGNHVVVVRSGATFQRGTFPFERTGKLRLAQAFRYE